MADPRKLKDEAAAASAKGKYKKAAELYIQVSAVEKDDPAWPHRAGEALRKAGALGEAIDQLARAAEAYAKQGFLLKAVSVAKMIVEIDPGRDESQRMLASLYARRDSGPQSSGSLRPSPLQPVSRPVMPAPEIALDLPLPVPQPSAVETTLPLYAPPKAPPALAPTEFAGDDGEIELDIEPELAVAPSPRPAPPPPPRAAPPPVPRLVGIDERPPVAAGPPAIEVPRPPPIPPPVRRSAVPTMDRLPLSEVIPGSRVTGQFSIDAFEIPLSRTEDVTAAVREIAGSPLPAAPALPKIPLFSSLDEASLRHLIETSRVVVTAPGEAVVRQGEEGDALYVIVRGDVEITAEGAAQPIARLGEGAFFGELAVLTEQPRLATVTAIDEVELLEIDRETIWQLIESSPDVLQILLRFFRDRLIDRLIATAPLFAPFSGGDSRQLAERFQFLEVKAGTVLVPEGQRADGLFILLAGQCDVEIAGHGIIAVSGPGEVVGEISLLTRGPSVATARARTRVWALALPRAEFQQTILTHPQVLEYVSEIAEARRAAVENRIRLV